MPQWERSPSARKIPKLYPKAERDCTLMFCCPFRALFQLLARGQRGILIQVAIVVLTVSFASTQATTKARVLTAPGVATTKPKDRHNTLRISGKDLVLHCPNCAPIQTVRMTAKEIGALRYGQNAYHHWIAGAVTGFFYPGLGAIVGFWPHHPGFFSIDLKNGKVMALQADKHNYKQMVGMLQNFAGLPIEVSAKDAHFLAGFNTKVIAGSK